jgi:hypothetical protein
MLAAFLVLFLTVGGGSGVRAQSATQTVAPYVQGHPACFFTSSGNYGASYIGDCGATTNAPNGFATQLLVTNGTGPGICVANGPAPGAPSGPYNQLCLAVTSTGATISLNPFGGAQPIPCTFLINGTSSPCVSGGTITAAPAFRKITASVSSDTALLLIDGPLATIGWASAAAVVKTETLYQCTAGAKGYAVTIKDEVGTASTYQITINATSSTIDNASTSILSYNLQSVTFQCDGAGNWIVL